MIIRSSHTTDFLQEADEFQQLSVLVVVVPAHDGDAIVDLVSIGVRGVVHQYTLENQKEKLRKQFKMIRKKNMDKNGHQKTYKY